MSTPEQLVNRFLAQWAEPEGFAQSFRDCFTDATVYENVGMSKTTGIAEAVAFADEFTQANSGGTIRVDSLVSAANGNTVLNERIDHIVLGDGTVQMSFRVVGVFEIEGGKITGWRDYFDTAGFFAKMAAEAPA